MYSIVEGIRTYGGGQKTTFYHPRTGKEHTFPAATVETAEKALRHAEKANNSMPLSIKDRGGVLLSFAEHLASRADELVSALTDETGAHPALLEWELKKGIPDEAALAADLISTPCFFDVNVPGSFGPFLRQPFGTALVIEPSNYRTNQLWYFIAAIAAGNRVIMKPSPKTPGCSPMIAQVALEAGMPTDWLQVVQAADESLDVLLNGADLILMTASSAACIDVKRKVAHRGIPVICEQNGCSFAIVTESADAQKSAKKLRQAAALNDGRVCFRPQVIFVQESRSDEFAKAYIKLAADSRFVCQSPGDRERILSAIDRWNAIDMCAIKGGNIVDGEDGFFVTAAVAGCHRYYPAFTDREVFGDVTVIVMYKDITEVLHIVNQSHALAVSVWGESAERLAMHLTRPSQVWANQHFGRFDTPGVPFCIGPFQQRGAEGIYQCTHLQGC